MAAIWLCWRDWGEAIYEEGSVVWKRVFTAIITYLFKFVVIILKFQVTLKKTQFFFNEERGIDFKGWEI